MIDSIGVFDSGVGGLTVVTALRRRLPAGFLAWAEGLNLFESSYLHPAPWRDA